MRNFSKVLEHPDQIDLLVADMISTRNKAAIEEKAEGFIFSSDEVACYLQIVVSNPISQNLFNDDFVALIYALYNSMGLASAFELSVFAQFIASLDHSHQVSNLFGKLIRLLVLYLVDEKTKWAMYTQELIKKAEAEAKTQKSDFAPLSHSNSANSTLSNSHLMC
jgi:hypothetical protein